MKLKVAFLIVIPNILLNDLFSFELGVFRCNDIQDKSNSSRKHSQDYFQLEGEIAPRQFCTLHPIELACFRNHYAGQDT